MILAATLALATAVAGTAAPVGTSSDACKGVVDRTSQCTAPAAEATSVLDDVKPPPEKVPGFDADKLPGELAFVGTGLALGGVAAVAWSFANTPRTDDERLAQDIARWSGASLLVWSGFTAVGAASLWIFDPSTGQMRPSLFGERE